MKSYEIKVTETITKYVTVEADSWEEAEEIAYQTDMDSNFDDYSLYEDMACRMRRYMDKYDYSWDYARDEAINDVINEHKVA